MNRAAKRKPAKPAFGSFEHARALGCYIEADGDLRRTQKLLRKLDIRVPIAELRRWEDEFRWPLFFAEARERLKTEAFEDAVTRKRRDLQILGAARTRLLQNITGKRAPDGVAWEIEPVRARDLESAAMAIARVIDLMRKIHGDGHEEEKQKESEILTAIREEIQSQRGARDAATGDRKGKQ